MTEADRTEMVKIEFERAWKMMHEAEINLNNKLWNVVGNRLYYSIFHAVSALLIRNNLKVGTHKGATIQFARNFILTGKFDKRYGQLYGQLQTIREKADYHNTYELEESEALYYFEAAKEFLTEIQKVAMK